MSQQPIQQRPSIVHYVPGEEAGSRKGEGRSALVGAMHHPEMPNLQVYLDGPNDTPQGALGSTLDGISA